MKKQEVYNFGSLDHPRCSNNEVNTDIGRW